ncbi:hypothetical protein [Sediminibacillus massiliensis]|uniref:hypothetical protein n=1 Tax=Sediminibacillus massiliensis TaxID=1926277 RepID=UPI0009885299|nr:hypothetical protein [Sediminibacillus massiliensis]
MRTARKFNTSNEQIIPVLPLTGDYEYCLEELELAFPKDQLEEITKQWEEGASIEFMAKRFKRHPDEVFLALFHQARKGIIERPFTYRLKGESKSE